MREAVIVSTARTPIGKAYRGAFNDLESRGHLQSCRMSFTGVTNGAGLRRARRQQRRPKRCSARGPRRCARWGPCGCTRRCRRLRRCRRRLAGLIGANITGSAGSILGIRPAEAALVGCKPVGRRGLVGTRGERDRVNRRAADLQRDGLGRSAIILKARAVQLRVRAVPAAGGAKGAGAVSGDVVADVGDGSVSH
jgi:hypothetical protein